MHIEVVKPGETIHLDRLDPADMQGIDRGLAEKDMQDDLEHLGRLQELLYVAQANAVLVVLQGTDTSGKDGTIRHVFQAVSPLGCRVTPFGVPTEEEKAHDFLWRIHKATPAKGMLGIFNRSHYESVLVERVHGIVSGERVRQRFDEINAFERMLTREGTIILKFFLHISKDEQEHRLRERMEQEDKRWKVNPNDWEERKRWGDYQEAYQDVLNQTSTDWAPWTVVPSDHKWFRNMIVAHRIVDVLEDYEPAWRKALQARGDAQMAAMSAWKKAQ